ncbi:DUF2304 domain-containing protein [Agrococcus sp. HG114]|uniref:DUF2304 domain-containing protein n=1 Tax=Agrococcus sp. HG114 TaxID=2969757 RepID=UPI00215AA49E|nr:DUF2304 domain-containing protein [Agrococcus sp. HG114]MCR8670421.1 DUF2304 domain-containing protein [Agrococcus sp. HG114]
MSPVAYVFSIVCAAVALLFAIDLLRRGRLRERHAIWWIVAGSLALLVAIFPVTLEWAASVIGAEVPTNLVFFVSIALLFGVALQLSSELTKHEEKIRTLAEAVAELELQVRRSQQAGEPRQASPVRSDAAATTRAPIAPRTERAPGETEQRLG